MTRAKELAKTGGTYKIIPYEHRRNKAELERRRFAHERRPTWMWKKNLGYRMARHLDLIPPYVEGAKYNQWELERMADVMLFEDPEWDPTRGILNPDQWKARIKHEIYVGIGTPDPSVVQGLYWRTHPQGLNWYSKEERKGTRRSFYR